MSSNFVSFYNRPQKKVTLHSQLPQNINNPWPGLSPYKDPKESSVMRKFCGRTKESFELTRMIDENIFVTLYGKSGNGKTSLLNAGVFPYLRKMQYFPISIRLGMDSIGMTFQQCIIQKIEKLFANDRIVERWVVKPAHDRSAVDFLWNYFARHRFYSDSQHNTIVYPVIVLDQFEEVYRNRREDADVLLRQINYLADESHELEDCEIDDGIYTYEYNFRFLVSIREDDLYHLEDSIDNNMLYLMKETRYRLRPLSRQGAKDVIFIPGEGLFDETEKKKISDTIIDIASGNDGELSSNVLSLICSRIYIDYLRSGGNGYISYELVNSFISDNPLEKFYLEATAHLTNSERSYLEDHLVDISGRRSFIPQANYEQVLKKKGASLLSGPQKILQENNERIELIHDSFCHVLTDQKTKRLDRWRTIVEYLALMAICFLLCYKQTLYNPFLMSLEFDSFLGSVVTFILGSADYFSIIFLFMGVGVIRKSFSTSFTWVSVCILTVPLVVDIYADTSTHLTLPHHIITAFLCLFTIFAHLYNLKNRPKDVSSRNTFSSLMDIRPLKLWVLVYMCFLVYYYVYKAPNGWYVGSMAYAIYLILIPALFYSIFKNEDNFGWVVIMILLLPIAFLIYYTSDTDFFSLSQEFSPLLLISIAYFLYMPINVIWSFTEDFDSTANRILVILAFLIFSFGIYAILYQYKLIMLTLWCLPVYSILYYLFCNENKYEWLLCVATFIVTIGIYTFSKGYNPLINNVRINEQKGEWHWNTVMAKSGPDYRLYDGLTGQDILGIGFDYQNDDKNMVKVLDHKINMTYEITNQLYEISGSDGFIIYKSHPRFEQFISRESNRSRNAAVVFQQHRKWIFNDFINPNYKRPSDQLRKIIFELSSQELSFLKETLATNNDSIIKENISPILCKVLSSSWLFNSTDSIGVIGDMYYFNYLCAFDFFTSSHFYNTIYQQKNSDWDGSFEILSGKYIECIDSIRTPSHDKIIETILPVLVDVYNKTGDYGLKTLLYGKIVRMQQIAILYGLGREKWAHSTLTSPVGVDINKYYIEQKRHKNRIRN